MAWRPAAGPCDRIVAIQTVRPDDFSWERGGSSSSAERPGGSCRERGGTRLSGSAPRSRFCRRRPDMGPEYVTVAKTSDIGAGVSAPGEN
jgi:hypothetical protein